jgi:hypothetical protein
LNVVDDAILEQQQQQPMTTISSSSFMDDTIKQLFIKLHRIYVEYILNPFTPIFGSSSIGSTGSNNNSHTMMIESKQFDEKIYQCITLYNNNNNNNQTH